MNELQLHEQYVAAHLEDRTAARSLVDHHQEALGVPRRVALRAVAAVRKHERDAREMAAAANIMADQDGIGCDVERIIRTAGSESWRLLCTILIVPGSRYPEPKDNPSLAHHRAYWHTVIRIGARRVLAIAEAVKEEMHEDGSLPMSTSELWQRF